MKGRPRKPTELKLLDGSYRADRSPQNEPKPDKIAPSCPSALDTGARREWKRLEKALEALGLLTELDRAAFASYCILWSRQEKIASELKKIDKKLAKLPDFSLIRSQLETKQEALLLEQRKGMPNLKSFIAELGLSATSRGRISLPGQSEEDDDWRDLAGKNQGGA